MKFLISLGLIFVASWGALSPADELDSGSHALFSSVYSRLEANQAFPGDTRSVLWRSTLGDLHDLVVGHNVDPQVMMVPFENFLAEFLKRSANPEILAGNLSLVLRSLDQLELKVRISTKSPGSAQPTPNSRSLLVRGVAQDMLTQLVGILMSLRDSKGLGDKTQAIRLQKLSLAVSTAANGEELKRFLMESIFNLSPFRSKSPYTLMALWDLQILVFAEQIFRNTDDQKTKDLFVSGVALETNLRNILQSPQSIEYFDKSTLRLVRDEIQQLLEAFKRLDLKEEIQNVADLRLRLDRYSDLFTQWRGFSLEEKKKLKDQALKALKVIWRTPLQARDVTQDSIRAAVAIQVSGGLVRFLEALGPVGLSADQVTYLDGLVNERKFSNSVFANRFDFAMKILALRALQAQDLSKSDKEGLAAWVNAIQNEGQLDRKTQLIAEAIHARAFLKNSSRATEKFISLLKEHWHWNEGESQKPLEEIISYAYRSLVAQVTRIEDKKAVAPNGLLSGLIARGAHSQFASVRRETFALIGLLGAGLAPGEESVILAEARHMTVNRESVVAEWFGPQAEATLNSTFVNRYLGTALTLGKFADEVHLLDSNGLVTWDFGSIQERSTFLSDDSNCAHYLH